MTGPALLATLAAAVVAGEASGLRVVVLGTGDVPVTLRGAQVLRPADLVGEATTGEPPPGAEVLRGAVAALVEQGRTALTELRFAEAVRLLGEAEARAQALVRAHGVVDALLSVHLYYAVALLRAGDGAGAARQLGRLVALRPDLALDPVQVPPDVVALRAEVRRTELARGRGSVTVRSAPAGAEVWVDGVQCGRTPATVADLVGGPHHVHVRHAFAQPWYAALEVAPARHETIELYLDVRRDAEGLTALAERAAAELGAPGGPQADGAAALLGRVAAADAIVLLRDPLPPLRWWMGGRRVEVLAPPAAAVAPGAPVAMTVATVPAVAEVATADGEDGPWYRRHWWIWPAAAVAVGATVTGAVLGARAGGGGTALRIYSSEPWPVGF